MPGQLMWGYDSDTEEWKPLKVDSTGSIQIACTVDELNDIGDVNVPTPTDGHILYWDNAASKWQAKAAPGDMLKSVYDTNANNIVDNSEKLEGSTKAQVQDHTPKAHKASHQDGGSDEISIEGLAGSPAQKAAASGLASLNASSKVVQQPAAITDHLEGTPTEDLATKAPTSEWAFDHKADKDAHHSNVLTLTFIIDGGGSAIATGQKGHLEIPFACTITQVTLLADQSGSIAVDIWKDSYANFPPTDADSITASAPPTISSAQKSQDSTLTDWTTAIAAGDILAFNVDSCTTIERVTISLKVTKS